MCSNAAHLCSACCPRPACLQAVKAPIDFNQYMGIQRMGIACLALPEERVREYAAECERRANGMVDALAAAGWEVPRPTAGGCMLWWCGRRRRGMCLYGCPGCLWERCWTALRCQLCSKRPTHHQARP